MPDNTFMEAVQVGSNLMARRQQMQSQQLQDALAAQAAQRQAELMPFQIKNQQLQQEIQTANLLKMTEDRQRQARLATANALAASIDSKFAGDYTNPEYVKQIAQIGESNPDFVGSEMYQDSLLKHEKAGLAKERVREFNAKAAQGLLEKGAAMMERWYLTKERLSLQRDKNKLAERRLDIDEAKIAKAVEKLPALKQAEVRAKVNAINNDMFTPADEKIRKIDELFKQFGSSPEPSSPQIDITNPGATAPAKPGAKVFKFNPTNRVYQPQ